MKLGPIIRRLRKERRLSQRTFGKMAGLGQTTIHNVETGKSKYGRLDVIEMIATAFGLRTSELVRLAEEDL
jgi:transcriptional regulator with XRE-family HTH domain